MPDTNSHDPTSLDEEITALRRTLRRAIIEADAADDLTRAANTIARLTEALVKAVRAHHAMRGEPENDVQRALEQVLLELGLSGE